MERMIAFGLSLALWFVQTYSSLKLLRAVVSLWGTLCLPVAQTVFVPTDVMCCLSSVQSLVCGAHCVCLWRKPGSSVAHTVLTVMFSLNLDSYTDMAARDPEPMQA